MVLIRVLVNPSVTNPPSRGDQIIGQVRLKAGENWIKSEYWDKVKNLPVVRQKMASGLIVDPNAFVAPPVQNTSQQPPQQQYLTQQPLVTQSAPVNSLVQVVPDFPPVQAAMSPQPASVASELVNVNIQDSPVQMPAIPTADVQDAQPVVAPKRKKEPASDPVAI